MHPSVALVLLTLSETLEEIFKWGRVGYLATIIFNGSFLIAQVEVSLHLLSVVSFGIGLFLVRLSLAYWQ